MTPILYLLFFASGAAALIYEVAWVRSFSVVFGGSHLAVTIVLSVYMGGIALGSLLLGRRADTTARPLRLYGLLELGIGATAVAVLGLLSIYPVAYGPLARIAETSRPWLTSLRVLFSVAALIVPTTLMGGTLPVLARALPRRLSFLYGINTLGAVAGAFGAGFFLLRSLGVHTTILIAASANALVGIAAIALSARGGEASLAAGRAVRPDPPAEGFASLPARLTLWGIGVSGFCALGYEVLWTRMLSLVVGTSVYSFAIMLVAFLAGIGLGSQAHGVLQGRRGRRGRLPSVASFGLTQIAVGASALAVTVLMRDLPSQAARLQSLFVGGHATEFGARQTASFVVAFSYMFVPAFFMGIAFPLAGALHTAHRGARGTAVGEVLTYNTVGAILGASVSGFVLVYAFGIERALQMLVVLNIGVGVMAALSARPRRLGVALTAAAALALLVALGVFPDWGRAWNRKYFAIYRNNQRSAFDTPERVADALLNTDVLYYSEGANEIISVIHPRGGSQAFLVNGRPEATTSPMDMQCQRALGHLPMLLHPNPKKVFVLGTGTGMTLGATSIHPEVASIVLAEIEPSVLGAARTFGSFNRNVLDNPKLRVVFNDGRNYLATTRETFDVVTADPIHPWSGGAAYLYTAEYFETVAAHLRPGGIACQWLPIYELSLNDLRMVVRTFGESFPHVMIWLTHYDAEIVGSNAPIVVDEAELARRLAFPPIAADLAAVEMGTASDLLSYLVAGDSGSRAFAQGGRINTDDNLALEFSAPESMGVAGVMGDNVQALTAVRENLADIVRPAPLGAPRDAQIARLARDAAAARLYDPAHALFLWGETDGAPFAELRGKLAAAFPDYAPFRFLEREYQARLAETPRRIASAEFPVRASSGNPRTMQVSAVTMRLGTTRAVVMFVDNDARTIFGQKYFDGTAEELDRAVARCAARTIGDLRAAYAQLPEAPPAEEAVASAFKSRVTASLDE